MKPIDQKATAIMRAKVRELMAAGTPEREVWTLFQAGVEAAHAALGSIVPEGHAVVAYVDDPEAEDFADTRVANVVPRPVGIYAGAVSNPRKEKRA